MRWLIIVIVASSLFLFAAPPARADDPPGAKLFGTYCAGCHGAAGKGGLAPAISTDSYLSTHDDAAIAQVVTDGMTATGMPAWSKAKGGALSDNQIADIVAYLRSLGSAAPAVAPSAVAQPASAANQVFVQAKLTVTQSTSATGDAVLTATLTDSESHPVSGATIAFSRATTFGVIDLGTVKTSASGMASLNIREIPQAAREIVATFNGDKNREAVTAKIVLGSQQLAQTSEDFNSRAVRLSVGDEPLLAPEGSLITPNPPLLPTALFALVVGCVWAMYAFVVSQIVGIWQVRNQSTASRFR